MYAWMKGDWRLLFRFFDRNETRIRLLLFNLRNLAKEKFECPICKYHGPFEDITPQTGLRKHAKCPQCASLERHRLQYLVILSVLADMPTLQMTMLHVAPEAFLKDFLSQQFCKYETADISMEGVDHKVDLQNLPFADATYDFVFASHVLEHIPNDLKALQEIRRILKPNGIAILPVPLILKETIDYAEPKPNEHNHVRAPGLDYFDRYAPFFSRVVLYSSDSLPGRYQLFIYEDRSRWGTNIECNKHIDIVPVCYV